MIDIRVRTQIPEEELQEKIGKILTEDDFNVLLKRATTVRKPDGSLMCVYLPGAIPEDVAAASYDTLHSLKRFQTTNRGLASGTPRVRGFRGSRTYTKPIASSIIGAFDAKQPYPYCRLTAWTGAEFDRYRGLWPLFEVIADAFKAHVPERFAAQMRMVERTRPEWVIEGTPFTTVTVNNTYPTGVHKDAGDLREGFGNLAVLRRGEYTGGVFTFPRYRVGVDMQDRDVLICDVHEWHGNTKLELKDPTAERISVVCYYRQDVHKCRSPEEEAERAANYQHRHQEGVEAAQREQLEAETGVGARQEIEGA
jgi:hypothetical protein